MPLPNVAEPTAHVSPESEFKRGLTLLDATMLVVGSMIGSGIFIVSADIARQMNSPGGLLFVWVATGLITVFGALSYGELAAAMPKAGGQYVFLREGLGHLPGFLYGWTLFLVIQTGTIAAVAVAFAKFLGVFFPAVSPTLFASFGKVPVPGGEIELGLSWQRVVAIVIIAILTAVNMRGLREAKWIQNTFTFAKTGALLGLILLAFVIGRNAGAMGSNFNMMWADTVTGPRSTSFLGMNLVLPAVLLAFGGAMVGSLFSSDAWNNVTFAAAEVKNPQRNLPLALALGTGLVTGLYLLANVAYLMVLRLSAIQNAPEDRVGTLAMREMLGDTGLYLMAAAILISTFGCINGLILAGARVYYAMARDGLFFEAAGRLSPKTHVPTWALLVQGIWTAFLTLTGSYGQLLDYVVFAALLFYVLTMVALFSLRIKRPEMERPYRAVGYPVIPALYMLSALFIAVLLLVAKPEYSFAGLFLVLLGVPVYYLWNSRRTPAQRAT